MARLLGNFFGTRAEVNPGYVVEKSEVMAAVQVNAKGLKAD